MSERTSVCSVDGCDGDARASGSARGWCKKHYVRWYRTGSVELDTSPTPCEDCSEDVERARNGNVRPLCAPCKRRRRTEYAREHEAREPDLAAARRARNRPAPEQRREERARSYERHRDRIVAERRAKYWADPEPVRAQGREWARLHPNQIKANNKRYAERVAAGSIGPAIHRPTIYERDGWVCGICHELVDAAIRWPHPLSPSLDHIVPVSVEPIHTPENVRLAHLVCNQRRGNKI